jgi:hypothetical protein
MLFLGLFISSNLFSAEKIRYCRICSFASVFISSNLKIYMQTLTGINVKSYLTNDILIYGENICAFPHIFGRPSSYMALHPIPSEFPYMRKFCFLLLSVYGTVVVNMMLDFRLFNAYFKPLYSIPTQVRINNIFIQDI